MKIGLINCWLGKTLYQPQNDDENSDNGWLHYSCEHIGGVKPGDVNYDREVIKNWVRDEGRSVGIYAPYWLAKYYLEEIRKDKFILDQFHSQEFQMKMRGWNFDKCDDFVVSI